MTDLITIPGSDKMTEKFIRVLERKEFLQVRAKFAGSPFREPKPIGEFLPPLTAMDDHQRLFIFEVIPSEAQLTEALKPRWKAFAEYATTHNCTLWILVPVGLEPIAETLCDQFKIRKQVKVIKGL